MRKNYMLSLLMVILAAKVEAQDCEAYFPLEDGAEVELHSFNAKGKLTGKTIQKFVSKEETAEGLLIIVHQINLNEKGENMGEDDLKYRCAGENFYMDMESFLNPQQTEGYDEGQVEVKADNIDLPSNPTPGQTLKDGFLEMKMVTDSPVNMNMSINITNRKVEAIEDITTPAGTYTCYKISQNMTSQTAFIKTTMQSVYWYSKNVGVVKNESYNKGKLMGYQELAAIRK